ncbi:hypothetical protein [Chryseobacterium lactis]|uniref:hypothetical protein n=1 Tax=Chryseobacterium lactis TaxID=1241981 RepID=UPI0016276D41|nr:hypothetical protein [Chryseobacterium lactis]
MMKKLNILVYFAFTAAFSQQKKDDSLVIKKMIIGTIENNVSVGAKINEKCQMESIEPFTPIHKYLEGIAVVTDYILCNNGNPNMFFEIYDGEKFKYVKDKDIKFPENSDLENPKLILSKRSPEERKFVRSNVETMMDFVKDFGNEEKEQELSSAVKEASDPIFTAKKYELGIISYYPTDNISATGASFKILNLSKKTIKYIWFTVAGKNAVEDLVKSDGSFYKTLRGIGPVEPHAGGSWSFDYVWLTDIIQTLKISTIKIQYMDGTFKTIKYNEEMHIGEAAFDHFNSVFEQKEQFEKERKK